MQPPVWRLHIASDVVAFLGAGEEGVGDAGAVGADGGFDLLLAGNTVFLHSPQDILHVGVVQGLAGAGPAYGLHNVDALTQQVQPDGISSSVL